MIIRNAGMLTTVQDSGRFHYQQYGVMASGAMDQVAMRIANILVGNPRDTAVLEMTVMGASMEFDQTNIVAITGADMHPTIDGRPVPMYAAVLVQRGETLTLGTCQQGMRTYVAFAGGLEIPIVMGRQSTLLRAGFGGYQGRKLKAGDEIAFTRPVQTLPKWELRSVGIEVLVSKEVSVHVLLGPQDDHFTDEGLKTFLSSPYTIRNESDRMGYRLSGPQLHHRNGANIVTDGIAFGSIQVPSDGQPIIMMADRQCTGGYTKIATVISADLPVLAQCRPGTVVHFQTTTIEDAQALLRKQRNWEDQLENLLQLGGMEHTSDQKLNGYEGLPLREKIKRGIAHVKSRFKQ